MKKDRVSVRPEALIVNVKRKMLASSKAELAPKQRRPGQLALKRQENVPANEAATSTLASE